MAKKIFLDSECTKHKGSGVVLLGDNEMCYGCWLEQFDNCPLCGKTWDDPTECKKGEIDG